MRGASRRRPSEPPKRMGAPARVSVYRLVLATLAVGALLAGAFGGCTLAREGTKSQSCTTDPECEDGSECTVDTCGADGQCIRVNVVDGPVDEQVLGDCIVRTCLGGELVDERDDGDSRSDDNPCTDDQCTDEGTIYVDLDAGASCTNAGGFDGVCDGGGTCLVDCEPGDPEGRCDDDNLCTEDYCDAVTGTCANDKLDIEPPDIVTGDCQITLCQNGKETPKNFNADVPDDDNECTVDVCNEGIPFNIARDYGEACSQDGGRVCNGAADAPSCLECNVRSDCPSFASDDDCNITQCNDGVCEVFLPGTDKPTTAQVAGNCKERRCNGNGGTTQVNANNDLPNDNNDCTTDTCSNGTPTFTPKALNSPCGNGLFCNNAGGICVGCNNDGQCPTDTACRDFFCNVEDPEDQFCDFDDAPAETITAMLAGMQVEGDCLEKQCDGAGAVMEVDDDDDVDDDDNDCTTDLCNEGTPMNVDRALNAACDGGTRYCDGAGECVDCNANSQCAGQNADACQIDVCNANKACTTANEPLGTPAPAGEQTSGDCKVVVCNGMGAVNGTQPQDGDLPDDNNQCTIDECNAGNPLFTPKDAGTPCNGNTQICDGAAEPMCVACMAALCDDGVYCNGAEICNMSGLCADGPPPCPGADGDMDCNETCNEAAEDCSTYDGDGAECKQGIFEVCCDGSCSETLVCE